MGAAAPPVCALTADETRNYIARARVSARRSSRSGGHTRTTDAASGMCLIDFVFGHRIGPVLIYLGGQLAGRFGLMRSFTYGYCIFLHFRVICFSDCRITYIHENWMIRLLIDIGMYLDVDKSFLFFQKRSMCIRYIDLVNYLCFLMMYNCRKYDML